MLCGTEGPVHPVQESESSDENTTVPNRSVEKMSKDTKLHQERHAEDGGGVPDGGSNDQARWMGGGQEGDKDLG